MPKGDQALTQREEVRSDGALDVLDLLFTPFPQFLPGFGIERLPVGKCDTCPSSKILEGGSITGGRNWKHEHFTLPFSSPVAGAVPAYEELIEPYETS